MYRHFRAWWGIGNILMKEQNYNEAIKYFKKALSLNDKSIILNSFLAQAYQMNKNFNCSIKYYEAAEALDPESLLIKFQKANIFFMMKEYDAALDILNHLDKLIPKESPIHVLLGRIYKIKKEYAKAQHHFDVAMDLNSKDSNMIKGLMEKLRDEEDDENSMNITD